MASATIRAVPMPASADVAARQAPPAAAAPATASYARRWLRHNRGALRAALLGALSIALFVALWHYLTVNRVSIYVRFVNVPSPERVLERAMAALRSDTFFEHMTTSCRRILIGFLIAGAIAVPLGLLMGRFKLLREAIFPVTEILRPIPAIAWVPMAVMLWPTNEQSVVFITFLGSFFPILINTLHGMATVDPVLVRAARCLGAREVDVFREVYLPASLPQIFTGLTVGMGVAWVSLIAAEMISGQFGIGYFTWEAYSLVQYADIALGMLTIGLLGLASSFAIRMVGKLLMPWAAAR